MDNSPRDTWTGVVDLETFSEDYLGDSFKQIFYITIKPRVEDLAIRYVDKNGQKPPASLIRHWAYRLSMSYMRKRVR